MVEIAIPVQDAPLQAGPDRVGVQRRAADQAAQRDGPVGVAAPRRWISNLSQAGRRSRGSRGSARVAASTSGRTSSGGRENSDGKLQAGVDVFKNLTPNMNASVTVNTDFAETEADDRQINLTRFPLFFPEKRAFFLEGAGVFEVAATNEESVLPFFSRRIGLLNEREVPILVGTKIVGRQSGFNIGVLDVQTRGVDDVFERRQPAGRAEPAGGARQPEPLRQSWIGAIVTHGNPEGTGDNTLVGVDMRLATSTFRGNKNLSASAFFLRTDDEASGTTDYSFGGNVDYPNDLWDCSFGWRQIGENFRPALGFVPAAAGSGASRPASPSSRGRADSGIRQLFFEVATGLGHRPAQRDCRAGRSSRRRSTSNSSRATRSRSTPCRSTSGSPSRSRSQTAS